MLGVHVWRLDYAHTQSGTRNLAFKYFDILALSNFHIAAFRNLAIWHFYILIIARCCWHFQKLHWGFSHFGVVIFLLDISPVGVFLFSGNLNMLVISHFRNLAF